MKKILLGLIGLLFAIPAVADLDLCRNLVNINASNIDIGHYISTSGAYSISAANFLYIPYIPVNPDTTYTLSWGGDELYYITISEYSTNNDSGFIRRNNGTTTGNTSLTITTGENTHYIRFDSNPYGNNNEVTFEQVAALRWQLEQGNATEYVPYCANQIRIATTVFNSARFSPVVTELNDTIATIRSVVTNTINQTKAIADLQATKQTRPDENCPAGKKCLLVEDDAGQPHWYEIIENADGLPSGYTLLQYITSNGTQYIADTLAMKNTQSIIVDGQYSYNASSGSVFVAGNAAGIWSSQWCIRLNSATSATIHAGSSSVTPFTIDSTLRHEWVLDLLNGKGYIDDVQQSSFSGYPATNGSNWYYLGNLWSGSAYGRIAGNTYSIKIYENGTLVHDMVPVKNSNNVAGLYDLLDLNTSTAFKTSATDSPFTAGPVAN